MWRAPALGLTGVGAAALATWATQGHPSLRTVGLETAHLLSWQQGPIRYHNHLAWLPLGVHLFARSQSGLEVTNQRANAQGKLYKLPLVR